MVGLLIVSRQRSTGCFIFSEATLLRFNTRIRCISLRLAEGLCETKSL